MLILAVLACGGTSAAPDVAATQAVASEATAPGIVGNPATSSFTPQPALPEKRFLSLEFPPRIRAGDSDIVRLTLEADDLGNFTPTAETSGNVITGKVVEVPNLYETHQVIAEARFDIAGMDVRPSDIISTPISQGQAAVFYWSVRPQEVGHYRGTIWLSLRYIDKLTGEETRKTVSAQIVEIEAVNLLGLPANLVRATGMAGSVIGMVLSIPFFESLLKFLVRRTGRNL